MSSRSEGTRAHTLPPVLQGVLPPGFIEFADQLLPVLWIMDGSGSVQWVNERAYQYFDVSDNGLQSRDWLDVVSEQDIPSYLETIKGACAGAEPVVHTIHVRRRGGDMRQMTVCLTPVALGGSGPGLFGIGIDTTSQRAVWAEADRKARVVDVLMSLLTEGVVLHGPDGTISYANAAAEEILGLPRSRMTGTHSRDRIWEVRDAAFHPFPGDAHPAQVTLRSGEPQRDVLMAVKRGVSEAEASWCWLSVNSRAVPNVPQVGDRSVLVTFTDVTEARAHEERRVLLAREEEATRSAQAVARRASLLADAFHTLGIGLDSGTQDPEDLLRLLVPDLADTCWILTSDPSGDVLTPLGSIATCGVDVVVDRSETALPLTALGLGHPLLTAVREQRPVLIESIGEEWQTWRGPVDPEAAACRPLSAVACPVHGSTGLLGGIVLLTTSASDRTLTSDDALMLQDIADRLGLVIENTRLLQRLARKQDQLATLVDERTRELTQVNEELRRSLRMKDEFLAAMSHELRTPLNAVLGTVELLSAELSGPLTDMQREDLTIIDQSGRHLLSLINDILDLAKIESGTRTMTLSEFDLRAVVRSTLLLMQHSIARKGLQLNESLMGAALLVTSDQRLVTQILLNLLSNAVKFTPSGGHLTVSLSHEADAGRVVLTVEDTGIGIHEEDLPRIFQPFEQIDGSLSREHEGTGLGLSLVARMVDMLEGNVAVSSVPGSGSRFTITLPTSPLSAGDLPAITLETPIPSAAPVILIADDNAANMRTFRSYLQLQGFVIREASNGIEAITSCGELRPDLIVMDIQMPKMDGWMAIESIRRNRALAHVPVIAVTALAMPGERALASGANAYLAKPVRLHELLAVIRELLEIDGLAPAATARP